MRGDISHRRKGNFLRKYSPEAAIREKEAAKKQKDVA